MKALIALLVALTLFSSAPAAAYAQATVPQGGTGKTSFPSGAILVGDSALRLTSTTSPTVGYITATSGTSTMPRLNVSTAISIAGEYISNFTTYVRSLFSAGTGLSYSSGEFSLDASIEDLNDVGAMTENYGDLLYWNGTAWSDIATSSLGISGGGGISTATYPLEISGSNIALAFGTTTSNTWAGTQTFSTAAATTFNVTTTGTYQQGGSTVLYASSTNQSLLLGLTGGTPLLSDAGLLRNTAAGYLAFGGNFLTTGAINNSAYGAEALYNLTSGDNNTALGRAAGYNLTTGNTNMFLGASAAFYNQTGIRNVAIGSGALRGNAVVHTSTDSNTAVGFEAGALIGASSDANIFLGQRAGDNMTSGSRNTIIGSDVDLPSATGSNQLVIGNIIFGTGVSGTGTTIAGSVGIGTSSPYARFSVGGDMVVGASTAGGTLGDFYLPKITSALHLADSAGKVTAYAGASCTNQVLTAISAVGAGTCNSVNNAYWSGTDLSVANGGTGLSTFGGSNHILYTTAADTLASEAAFLYAAADDRLTVVNASTTALSSTNIDVSGIINAATGIFTSVLRTIYSAALSLTTNGDFGIDSTSNQFRYQSGGATKVLGNGNFYSSFTYSTTTAWTGTTTIALGPAYVGETWNGVQCFTDTGTLSLAFDDGTNVMNYLSASTTVGTVSLSTNNTFTTAEKRYVKIGNPASSPTTISCTVSKSLTSD